MRLYASFSCVCNCSKNCMIHCFCCLCFLQDNYTFAQPGIQKKVKMLEELVSRIDGKFFGTVSAAAT